MAKRKRTKPAAKKAATPKPNPALMTRVQLATAFGVTPMTITRWERDGMPVAKRAPRGQPSKFDHAAVKAWREKTEKPAGDGDEPSLSLFDERAKLARRQTEKIELELAQRRGDLVEREKVILTGQTYTKAWTAKVRSLPRRLVQAGLVTFERESDVAAMCRELLTEISSWRTVGDADVPTEDATE